MMIIKQFKALVYKVIVVTFASFILCKDYILSQFMIQARNKSSLRIKNTLFFNFKFFYCYVLVVKLMIWTFIMVPNVSSTNVLLLPASNITSLFISANLDN